MHGIQVVNERLHGLISGAVRFLHGVVLGKGLRPFHALLIAVFLNEEGKLRRLVLVHSLQLWGKTGARFNIGNHGLDIVLGILDLVPQHQRLGEILPVEALEGLLHAVCHTVVEVHDALTAVLVILIRLNGNAS